MDSILQETSIYGLAFLMLFTCGIAIFYTILIPIFYELNDIPSWFFFLLLPSILFIVFLISKKHVFLAFIIIFIMVFVLMIAGMFYQGLSSIVKGYQKKRRKKESHFKIISSVTKGMLLSVVIGITFLFLGAYSLLAIILFVIFRAIVAPSSTRNFLSLQASLPTSKLGSMAMGLVEVKGKAEIIKPLISKIEKLKCVGYRYKVESIQIDSDGHKSYSVISDDVFCNSFNLKDDTGEANVSSEDLEFVWIELTKSFVRNARRYSEYVLFDGDKVLIIGKANSRNNKNYIEKEEIRNIFSLIPENKLSKWNMNKPLLDSLLTYVTFLAILVSVILMSSIEISAGVISFSFTELIDALNKIKN